MNYAELTFNDRNPVKRWLQRKRLASALNLVPADRVPSAICDFGAGSGELCKVLRQRYPDARICCYEPTPALLAQARDNLRDLHNIEFRDDAAALAPGEFDLVFCLEVFEHLPPAQTRAAMRLMRSLLCAFGVAIIGVPVEIGPPALYKGFFRMARRLGEFDAIPMNVMLSLAGMPPRFRPVGEIAPGAHYHFHHMGFDYRMLQRELAAEFRLAKVAAGPFGPLGTVANPEVYFVVGNAA